MKRFASVHVILTITFYEEKEIYRVEKNKNITSHRLLVKSQYSLFYLILKKATTKKKKLYLIPKRFKPLTFTIKGGRKNNNRKESHSALKVRRSLV